MKKNVIFGVLSSVALMAGMASCSDDYNPVSSSTGSIRPVIDFDAKAIRANAGSRATAEGITVDDLSLKLVSADGSVNQTWTSVSDFDFNREFRIGRYTLDAFYGNSEAEGFEAPYYFGTADFNVKEGTYTPVVVDVKLANSMVSIIYTEAFQNYFSAYKFNVKSAGTGAYHEYTANENRPLYLKPGEIVIYADVTKQNGVSATLEAAKFTAKSRYHHTVTVDVNGGNAGAAQMVISFDETLNEETVEIDLSDDLLSSPAPVITPEGFDSETVYSIINGTSAEINPKFTVVAQAGLSSVILTTASASLREQGWPDEIDLCAASVTQQAQLNSLGLTARGVFGTVDKMAYIDLTKVLANISYREYGNNDVKFTLLAKDKLGKVSDAVSLSLKILPIDLSMANASQVLVDDVTVSFDVITNGESIENDLKVQYNNAYGTWTDTEIISVQPASRASNTYRVTVSVPADLDPIVLRTVIGSAISNETTINRAKPDYTLAVNENNIFATYGKVAVLDKNGQPVALPSGVAIEVSTDGGNTFSAVSASSVTGGAQLALAPATSYQARLVQNGLKSKTVNFTSEVDKPLENGTFDASSWSILKENSHGFHCYGVTGWATLNEKTTSAKGTGVNNNAVYGYITTSGTKPDGDAALIRTVGWGPGNTASANAFNQKSFGTCDHLTPGQLFLGTFDASSYTPSYGIEFPSRPKSVSFKYKYSTAYDNNNGDYGTAVIKVFDANGNVISESEVKHLERQGNFTTETLDLNYPDNSPKAVYLSIIFKSSDWIEDDKSKLNATYVKPPAPLTTSQKSNAEYLGSQLWIDDVTLNY